METKRLNRRTFLHLSALTFAGALAACAAPPAPPPVVEGEPAPEGEPEAQEPVAPAAGNEAPELAAQVAAGTLPPLDERIPADPCVCVLDGFDQEIGTYGGTLAIANTTAIQCARESPFILTQDATKVIPQLAKAWEYNEDGTTLTVYLREGTRWSDGEPFTADDCLYFWEAYVLNDTLVPTKPSNWMFDGELAEMVKVDDFTVEMRFPKPYYAAHLTLSNVAQRGHQNAGAGGAFFLPKHFLEQYHIDTNPDADQVAKDAGYENWNEYFAYWVTTLLIPVGIPTLQAWVITEETSTGNTWERNPYYHKVDPEGNQLPYINSLNHLQWGDTEAHTMMLVSGQLDFEAWGIGLPDYPVLKNGEEKGGYEAWMSGDVWPAWSAYWFNQNYDADPELMELYRDARFRRALSLAIDRDEINEKTLLGVGMPTQVTVWKDAAYYKPEWAEAYAAYDPDQANALLDEMGLTERDAEGFRTKLNGDQLVVTIDLVDDMPQWVPASELVKSGWDAVGVRTVIKVNDRDLIWERLSANELQVFCWVMDGAHPFVLESSKAGQMRLSWWGALWYQWLTSGGEAGEEPPDDVKELYALCEQVPSTPPDQMGELMTKLWDMQAENLYSIGTVGYAGKPAYNKTNLGNVNKAAYGDNHDTGGARGCWVEVMYWKS